MPLDSLIDKPWGIPRFDPIGICSKWPEFLPFGIETILDERSDQTQQFHVLRAIASLTKECTKLNVRRFSTRGYIGDVSYKNVSRFGFASEQPSIAVWAVVELPISRTMHHLGRDYRVWLNVASGSGNFLPGASTNSQA